MSNDYKVTLTFKVETENYSRLLDEIGKMRKIINVLLEFSDDKTVKDYSSAASSVELIE